MIPARLVDDYLNRALSRRRAATEFLDQGLYVDAVKDARQSMDMVMLASMLNSDMPTPAHYIADDHLPDVARAHQLTGAIRFLDKKREITARPVGTVVPSEFYTV